MSDADVTAVVAGVELEHPVMLASGSLSTTAEQLMTFGATAAAVVSKSVSIGPDPGNPRPRIVSIDHDGMLNYEGAPNPGIEAFAGVMHDVVLRMGCPLICSMQVGTTLTEGARERVAATFEEAGAAAIELDFKYLYDEANLRTDFFTPEQVEEIVCSLRPVVRIPLIAKLAFGTPDIVRVSRVAEAAGADAITAINTVFPGMKIGARRRAPMLARNYGGLSGAPIRPLAVATVFQIASAVEIPVIGVGGIMTGEDVVEFLLAGASAVQLFTAAMTEKERVFTRIVGELRTWMVANRVGSLAERIGRAESPKVARRADEPWPTAENED